MKYFRIFNTEGEYEEYLSSSGFVTPNVSTLRNGRATWIVGESIHVTGITISEATVTIDKGSGYTLTATVYPSDASDKAVIWSTNNSNIATVVDGYVTGVGCGDAIITATSHDGGFTAQCAVSVEKHVTSVDINSYVVEITSGDTYQLVATVSPSDACDKSVTWASDDTSVATVNNGLVSGVTTGSATVTVTTVDGGFSRNCAITVNEPPHATAVTVSEASISVNTGKTHPLYATVLPNDAVDKSVTWSSSDSNIASVDSDGVVSGVASGSAVITVTTVDGGLTAQCSVSVTANHDYSEDYFTIESLEDDNEIKFGRSVGGGDITELHIAASTDDGVTWTEYVLPYENGQYEIATINSGDKILFKYISGGFSKALSTSTYFITSGKFNVYGNAMSLVKADDFTTGTTSFNLNRLLCGSKVVSAENLILPPRFSNKNDLFAQMFSGCTNLTTPPLVLPETTLGGRSYNDMFNGCTSLETAPVISATTLATNCYRGMFSGCTSLTTAPELPATTLADNCYRDMFNTCTSLTEAPELPATTLASECYRAMFANCSNLTTAPFSIGDSTTTIPASACAYMFDKCTSLTTAPSLPATAVSYYCYLYMFYNCTSLTTAPELPATTMYTQCYRAMFDGCTSLTTAPAICATTMAGECCRAMFANCTSLTTVPVLSATTLASGCYYYMFDNCSSLITVPSNMLPATTLASNCYYDMFHNCTSLTTAPELSATTLASGCYNYMFEGCTSLTTAPVLPATTLASECYRAMFSGCTALTTVYTLPATTLENSCYKDMFNGCMSLITAPTICATTLATSACTGMFSGCRNMTTPPELPATTLADYCYYGMFNGCKYITAAPELPATTLTTFCYHQMFKDCSRLNYVKCLATDISAANCTSEWLYHVSNSGTFVKSSSMSDWERGYNGIPTNWTVYDDTYVNVTGVTISTGTATVDKGDTYTLTASVLPNNATDTAITWSTSDATVATVDSNGVISGISCGNATITVTTHEGGFTAQCAVSVEKHVTSVDINTYILTIASGNTYQLEATVSPNDACNTAVTWSSNNTSVATVDSTGLVSGVTTGSATVTVTSVDNSSATRNCAVTVNEPQHPTAVTISDASISIYENGRYTLTATVLPSDAVDKSVTWSSSDSNVATVDSNGVVSGISTGNTIITVTTNDGGLTAQCSVTVLEAVYTSIAIEGASNVSAETCEYRAICDNVEDVTSSATWSITAGSQYATINSSNGQVTILNGANESSVTIQVEYSGLITASTVTLTYVSGATSETTSETATDIGGNATTVTTTVTEYEDGSSVETVETVITDVNGNLVGTTESNTTTNADGSYNGTTTNYDANGDPTNGSNVTGDTDGNVSTQTVEYDDSGNTVVTGYEIDTSESESGKTFNSGGTNTEYYAFDLTHGFVLDFDFTIDFANQPAGQSNNHHNILTAKRADPSPWYGFQLRHSNTQSNIQLGTQFASGNNTNTDISPASTTGTVGTYNLRIMYDPTSTGTTFTCINTATQATIYTSNLLFPDIEALKYIKITIGYAVTTADTPFRYSNITVSKFELKKLKHVANPTITYQGGTAIISCDTVGADLYYRLNLSGSYSAYTTPITITADTVVQAYATYSGDTSDIVREDIELIEVTGVTISDNSITIGENNTYALSATVLPSDALDKSVTWSSSDSNIASVDSSGVVSGVASGSAIITVTTVDGGYTAQCSVSVSEHDYSQDYFTIESLEDSNEIKMQRAKSPNNPTLSYSLDNGETWTTATISGTKSFGTINTGEKIIFKGTNIKLSSAWDTYNYFNATKQFKVYGNIMSLFNGDNFRENSEFNSSQTNHCAGLFRTTYLVDASNLILPAQTLYTNSYNGMFRGATALQHGPQMLATTPTGTECCASMFEGCINLEEAIEIRFTTLAQQCCFRMFCMNRTSKITTPKMTKSPILRCNTAATDCYKEMFEGNGSLNEITCLLTNDVSATANWVQYAGANEGTFYKHPDKTWTQGQTYGVPSGWNIVDYAEE